MIDSSNHLGGFFLLLRGYNGVNERSYRYEIRFVDSKRNGRKKGKNYLWRCECDCGGEKVVPATYLLNSHTKSCGCLTKNICDNSIKKGDRFGRLEAVEFIEYAKTHSGTKRAVWKFKCDCGNEKIMPVNNVKFGNVNPRYKIQIY